MSRNEYSSGQEEWLTSTGFLLAMVGAESRRRFTQALEALALRPTHYGALMTLAQSGPAPQHQLARSVGVDPRNFVLTLDTLEERGLIRRTPHPQDRRRYQVELTAAGTTLLGELREVGDQAQTEFLAPLTESEQSNLRLLLLKLYESHLP